MKKILFLATYPHQTNGYAKIGNKLSNYLAQNNQIYYFGFSNYKDVYVDRFIHSNITIIDVIEEEKKREIKESFGVDIIEEFITKINPDIVLIYNDLIVTCRHLNVLNQLRIHKNFKFKVLSYLDLVYDFEKSLYINFVGKFCDMIMVFSEHWKNNLIDMGINSNKIRVIYHGLNEDMVFKLDKQECRRKLNLKPEDFILLNVNRNSYRKANDIAISAFLKFLKMNGMNSKIKYLIHCDMVVSSGYDIYELIKIECIKEKVDYATICDNHIIKLSEIRVSDEKMNYLYNACDVGINTCIGEGFGLCSFEHITLGKPQVVSLVGAHKDIFKNYNEFTVAPVAEYQISAHTDDHLGTVFICNSKDFADKLNTIYHYYKKYEIIANKCGKYIKDKYNWNDILKYFESCLNEL